MPDKRSPSPGTGPRRVADGTPNFRKRFDAIEQKRAQLLQRLRHIKEAGHSHPGAKRALTLLNQTFRKANLVQRLAILQAAEWIIQLIEMSPRVL